MTPTAFLPDRTAEDYGFLRDPARRGDWSDAYKFVPLSSDGDSYLSFGGEVRERVEIYHAPRFGLAGGSDDTYLLQRILAHADLRIGTGVRVFAQLGAHEAYAKKAVNLAPPDDDSLDVHQLFVEVRPAQGAVVRIGRQEMIFNPLQRFVSFRDGTNVRQNFDGGRLSLNRGATRVDAFLNSPVTLRREEFDNSRNRDHLFGGLYVSHKTGPQRSRSLDAYYFMLDRNVFAGPGSGDDTRHNLGVRYAGTRGAVDWDAEGVYQFGNSLARDVRAWAGSVDLGYTLRASSLKPRLGLRFDSGSGDDDAADGEVNSFYPLFPSGPYFNEANLTSWTNLLAIRPSVRLQPTPKLTVIGAAQLKWRQDRDDAVYLGPSNPLVATRANRAREIGQVYTLDANYQLNRNIALRAYYLHHTDGEAIARAGGEAVNFGMASVTLRF